MFTAVTLMALTSLLRAPVPDAQIGELQLVAAVLDVSVVNTCDADEEFLRLDVRMNYRLVNRGRLPLIVPASLTVFEYRAATDLERVTQAPLVSQTLILGRDPDAKSHSGISTVPDRRFLVVKPSESASVPGIATFLVLRREAAPRMFVQVTAGGFYDITPKDWATAEKKWAKFGHLWSAGLHPEPFAVSIADLGTRRQCGDVSEDADTATSD